MADTFANEVVNEDVQPLTERWAPLGAVASPEPGGSSSEETPTTGRLGLYRGCSSVVGIQSKGLNDGPVAASHPNIDYNTYHHTASLPALEELRRMEMEQEQLNNSLLALTSHFAQVQFRLKQIIDTDSRNKDDLLKELEEFAFRGVPDLSQAESVLPSSSCSLQGGNSGGTKPLLSLDPVTEEKIQKQRKKQLQLIEQLKVQLEDLETYAFETGELELPPTSQQLEKQKLVIDELKEKLSLDLDDYNRLSTVELKKALDIAVGQIVNPAKKKEKLVDQLKTQIVDLERFIEFLQGDTDSNSTNPAALTAVYGLGGKFSSHAAGLTPRCNCHCSMHNKKGPHAESDDTASCSCEENGCPRGQRGKTDKMKENSMSEHTDGAKRQNTTERYAQQRQQTIGIMRRAITLLQLFAASQLGCGLLDEQGRPIIASKNGDIRPPEQRRHWGDLRARLEIAIEQVVEKVQFIEAGVATQKKRRAHRLISSRRAACMSTIASVSNDCEGIAELKIGQDCESVFSEATRDEGDGFDSPDEFGLEPVDDTLEEYHSDTEEYMIAESQKEITHLIRREFCPALSALLQHGLVSEMSHSRSILPIGCFSSRKASNPSSKALHAWELFVKFYELKHGREYNESAARKLSESFDLEIVGGKAITVKQQLLSAIGSIVQTHGKFKRSEDAKFKALICTALNEKKLIPWLKLIVKNPIFLDFYYQPWSYTVKTGFNDALHSLNRLSQLNFRLPHDLAVRQFKNIKDAF